MRTLVLLIALVLCCVVPTFTSAQQKSEPQFKLVEFHLALLKKGPKWTTTKTQETMDLHEAHVAYASSLLESGKAIIAGPLTDDGEIRGVYIFRAQSADEAKTWAAADPAVAAGHLVAEMHPWWAADVLKKPAGSSKTETAYLAFLARGPNWTADKTPAIEELSKGHMANIIRLAEMKKLVVAGPFGGNSNLAGVFVFRVGSLAEAQALTATDPAVKAERFVVDIHPWQVPEGILP